MFNDLLLLFKGFCTGFFYTFISIPSMVLVSHYIIRGNALRGFIAALGIVTVQVIWSSLGAFLLLGSFKEVHSNSDSYAIIGSIILFIMAIKIYRSKEKYNQQDHLSTHLLIIYGSGLLISIIVPIRILGYMAIFGALGIADHPLSFWHGSIPIIGVFCGTLLWWTIFTFCLYKTKQMISPKTLHKFHKYAAFILVIFSVLGLLQVYF